MFCHNDQNNQTILDKTVLHEFFCRCYIVVVLVDIVAAVISQTSEIHEFTNALLLLTVKLFDIIFEKNEKIEKDFLKNFQKHLIKRKDDLTSSVKSLMGKSRWKYKSVEQIGFLLNVC